MAVTQKTQYALRAMFELAKRVEDGPAKINEVALAQDIPPRFLEVILAELKQGGFTESRRGKDGGYYLSRSPDTINIGEVIRFTQGPLLPVDPASCEQNGSKEPGAVFRPLWRKVETALGDIYDGVTFADLVEQERSRQYIPDFTI